MGALLGCRLAGCGKGLGKALGGNGRTPMGLRCRDDQMEGRAGHRSSVEVCSYPYRQHDTDCQLDQNEMVPPVECRRVVPACSVDVREMTVFGLKEVQDQWD
jgi:hypothetical protein